MRTVTTLGRLVEKYGGLIQTGPFGSQLHQRDYTDTGIPVVMPKDIRDGRVDETGIARIPEAKAQPLARHILDVGSIVFPRRGDISKCAYIDESQAGFLCGSGCIKIEAPSEVVIPKYLHYYLGLRHVVEWLERNAVGTTMLNLNSTIVGNIQIPLVPIDEQQKVVDILSAYDDLIENNRRRIGLLEQAARLLYKEWFVHLRFPGHEHVGVVEGVPAGWEMGKVSDFYDTASGGTPSRKYPEYFTGEINWVKTQELNDGWIFTTEERITPDAVENSSAKIFPVNTVLIAMYGATIGQTGLLAQPSATNQACCAILPGDFSAKYVYAYLFFLENKEGLKNLSQGAAQNNVSQQVIRNYPMLMPPKLTLEMFAESVQPMVEQTKALAAMNAQLAQARDLLLPRLMSGEIAV